MWVSLLIGLLFAAVSYLLQPKPKVEQPAAQDMDNPTADAGRPVPVVFGTVRVQSLNVLWYGDKARIEREPNGGSKK